MEDHALDQIARITLNYRTKKCFCQITDSINLINLLYPRYAKMPIGVGKILISAITYLLMFENQIELVMWQFPFCI